MGGVVDAVFSTHPPWDHLLRRRMFSNALRYATRLAADPIGDYHWELDRFSELLRTEDVRWAVPGHRTAGNRQEFIRRLNSDRLSERRCSQTPIAGSSAWRGPGLAAAAARFADGSSELTVTPSFPLSTATRAGSPREVFSKQSHKPKVPLRSRGCSKDPIGNGSDVDSQTPAATAGLLPRKVRT